MHEQAFNLIDKEVIDWNAAGLKVNKGERPP
jgi:hypothetical protein